MLGEVRICQVMSGYFWSVQVRSAMTCYVKFRLIQVNSVYVRFG